jgi:hypothetical protein
LITPLFGGHDDARRPAAPRLSPAAARAARRTSSLREVLEDPGYLAFKESIGEPLTPGERARLEAARAGAAAPEGGGHE